MNWSLFYLVTSSISSIIIAIFVIGLIVGLIFFIYYSRKILKNIKNISKNVADLSDKVKVRADDAIESYDRVGSFFKIISRFFKK